MTALGCLGGDLAQGYLLAHPMPAKALAQWRRQNPVVDD